MFRFLSTVLAILLCAAPADAARRALVIGNDAYDQLPDLQKAVADARAYDAVLRDLGYDVRLETNLATPALQQAVGEFLDRIERGDEVAFVYAGHGWSDGATNYIIGTETETQTSLSTLRRAAVPLRNGANGIIDDIEAKGARVVVAIIDACRTNPFQSKTGRSGTVGLSRGLVLMSGPSGTFTVFSAGAGEEALDRLGPDDEDRNSVFSRVFLAELAQGGSLQDTILDTAPKVAELAMSVGHVQRPAYYDGIGQRYCLTEDCAPRAAASGAIGVTEADAPADPVAPDAAPLALPEVAEIAPLSETPETPLPEATPPGPALPSAPLPTAKPPLAEAVLPVETVPVQTAPSASAGLDQPQLALVPFDGLSGEQPAAPPPAPSQADPYQMPEATAVPAPQPYRLQPGNSGGEPVQFIVRSASPIRSLPGLDRESVCSVGGTASQPTIAAFYRRTGMAHHNREFPNLRRAVSALERSRCGALVVPPRLVPRVMQMVRDTTRYVVLPDIVR